MNKKKTVLILFVLIVFLIFFAFVLFFFKAKNYTYYVKESIGSIQGINIQSDDYETRDIWVFNEDDVNELYKYFENLEAWPCTSSNDGGAGFRVSFLGEDEKIIYFSAYDGGKYYIVNINEQYNGMPIENTIWDAFGSLYISKEDGEKLFEIINGIYEDNYRNIYIEDIQKISNNNEMDWRKFTQFIYSEIEEGELIEQGEYISEKPVRFEIKNTSGYMDVWYYNVSYWDVESNVSERYSKVIQAIVYDESGNSMNIYDDGIDEFLEMIK